jgi:hypothetical protein
VTARLIASGSAAFSASYNIKSRMSQSIESAIMDVDAKDAKDVKDMTNIQQQSRCQRRPGARREPVRGNRSESLCREPKAKRGR